MRNIDLVIIDFDDTLSPTEELTFRIENSIASSMDFHPMTRLAHQQNWGKRIEEAITERFPGISASKFMDEWTSQLPVLAQNGRVDTVSEDNLAVLDKLVEKGFKLAILTSRTTREISHLMEMNHPLNSGRIERFYPLESSDYIKPDPKVFEKPLTDFGVLPDRVVYIGDSPNDGIAAKGAGLHFIASFEYNFRDKNDFSMIAFDGYINKFTELVNLLT